MATPETTGPGGQEELMKQLRTFLQGASGGGRGTANTRMAATALHLLTHLPAAREAVFEYYSGVLDAAVGRYNPNNHGEMSGGAGGQASLQAEEEERVIADLQRVLSGFIESNPQSWSPIVSKWSLDSLGRLSSKYSNKITGGSGGGGGKIPLHSLNEKLSSWLGCLAAKTLLDLAAECLAKLMHEDTEACVAALLDTSVRHTPHFDWVVAHLGSCFPHTVIRRVLTVGLKDFTSHAAAQDGAVNLSKVPKLMSVVNILSHLAATHQADLQQAVHQLLLSSLDPAPPHLATVPYLLNLASQSTTLRRALTTDLAEKLTPDVTDRIAAMAPSWVSSYFPAGNSLLNLATHLLQSTDRGGPALLALLLDRGMEGAGVVPKYCRIIVHLLLAEIFQQVHGVMRHRTDEVPVFSGLADSMPVFLNMLLSDNSFKVQAATQLMALYALHRGRSVSAHLVKFMLFSATTANHLRVFTELLKQIEIFHFNCVSDAVGQSLKSREGAGRQQLLQNLAKLVAHEQQQQEGAEPAYRSSFSTAVRLHQSVLVEQLTHPEVTPLVLELFQLVPPEPRMRASLLHKMCHHLVHLVFLTIQNTRLDQLERVKRVHQCETVLRRLCQQATGLQIVLRFVIDACLNSQFSSLLGGQQETEDNSEASVRQRQATSLMKANLKFGSMPVQLGPATVFHAGVIGSGVRQPPEPGPVSREAAEANTRIVAGLIIRLCEDTNLGGQAPGEGNKQLSLVLVEVVSPDIMYNGLPWPEEEFMKVTVERDLSIGRLLARHPILWCLLDLLAAQRPALCYCSAIIRAVMALSIAHWQSSVVNKTTEHSVELERTRKVLELMAVGQFLPPQLAAVPQVMHLMDSFQLHCVLIDIWNFMKMNVPGPNLFVLHEKSGLWTRDFGPYTNYKVYCERLRVIMVKNIGQVSGLFKKLFVDVLRESENGHMETE